MGDARTLLYIEFVDCKYLNIISYIGLVMIKLVWKEK